MPTLEKTLLIAILCFVITSVTISPALTYAESNDEANCDGYEKVDSLENKKVIVIGAGVSGLAAAHHLHCKGYDVEVLEAQNRTGGRIFTVNSSGVALDRGASWIHGIEGSPIFALATKYDLRGDIIITNQDSSVTYDSEGELVNATREEQIWDRHEEFKEFLREKQATATKNDSLGTVVDEFIANITNTQDLEDFYYSLYWEIELDNGVEADETSLRYWDQFQEYPSVEVIFRHGYGQIIDILAEGLTLHLEQEVKEVDYTSEVVRVNTNQLSKETDYVVSTLPLGVLEKGSVRFTPDLSSSKKHAIDSLDMGVFNKVYLIFPKVISKDGNRQVFWEDDKNKDWITRIPKEGERGQWVAFLNLYKYTNEPILLAFNSGKYSSELNKNPDDKIIEEGMKVLRTIYQDEDTVVPNPTDYIITKWEQENFTGGSFSHFKNGTVPSDFDALAEPEKNNYGKNKVFFAGEATIQRIYSTVNGAYVSGIRAAEQIQKEDGLLDSPKKQVEYGAHPTTVVCKDDLVLILKSKDFSPRCVENETAQKLYAIMPNAWIDSKPEHFEYEEMHSPAGK